MRALDVPAEGPFIWHCQRASVISEACWKDMDLQPLEYQSKPLFIGSRGNRRRARVDKRRSQRGGVLKPGFTEIERSLENVWA